MYIGWDVGIKFSVLPFKKKKIPDTIENENDKMTYIHIMNNILIFGDNVYQIIDWNVINIVSNVNDKQLIRGELH